jgi:hypothetical protein
MIRYPQARLAYSNKLAETWNGFDDRIDIAIACLVSGVRNKLAGDALNLAHVQPSRHQPAAHAHNSASARERPAPAFGTCGSNRLSGARQASKQTLHRVSRTFSCQEIEDNSQGSLRNWAVNAHIADDLVDEFVHSLLVHLAPPARRNHIAHYIRLDKAEQKFGGDVLQIDNACAERNLWRPVVAPMANASFVQSIRAVSKCGVFKMRCVR